MFLVSLVVYTLVNNHLGGQAWDPYPFILLNLILSMLAALQAPVIMMSQNRQDAKDRLRSELDYEVNRRAELEVRQLSGRVHMLNEKIDELQVIVVVADQKVVKCKEELVKAQQQVRDQEGLLLADVKRLEAELVESEKGLPDDFRDAYQRLVKSKGSDAMAAIEGENCGGCYQTITSNMFNSLLMSKLVACANCGRLLYLPEDRTPGQGGS